MRQPQVADEQGIPPTSQTLAKCRADVVLKLNRSGRLWNEHLAAALQIRSTWEAFGRGLYPTAVALDAPGKQPKRAQFRTPLDRMSRREWETWRQNYVPWSKGEGQVIIGRGRATRLRLTLDIVADNIGLRVAEQAYGMRHGLAYASLRGSLHRYAVLAGWLRGD